MASRLKLKTAVSYCGLQLDDFNGIPPNCVWILGPNIIINKEGERINENDCKYVWLSDIDSRSAGRKSPVALPITLPLGNYGLIKLVDAMRTIMRHNFYPSVLALGAAGMLLHYSRLMRRRGHCHVPLLFGKSQTGKTTALVSALAMLGCHRNTLYSRGTKEAYLSKCCSSVFPIGCDDPQSQATTGQLIVELFNGAKCTTVKHGDQKPLTSTIISANFSLSETTK